MRNQNYHVCIYRWYSFQKEGANLLVTYWMTKFARRTVCFVLQLQVSPFLSACGRIGVSVLTLFQEPLQPNYQGVAPHSCTIVYTEQFEPTL